MRAVLKSELSTPSLRSVWRKAGLSPGESCGWADTVLVKPCGRYDFQVMPHQVKTLHRFAKCLPRYGLWDEMGTGKTLSMQLAALWLVSLGNKIVFAVLPVLVDQIIDNFKTNFDGLASHVRIEAYKGDPEDRQELIKRWEGEGWPDILVMSYDMFKGKGFDGDPPRSPLSPAERVNARDTKERRRLQRKNPFLWTPGMPIAPNVFAWNTLAYVGYSALFVDEAHNCKSSDSHLYKSVQRFVQPERGDESRGLVLATGSPIQNTLEDAYAPISLLVPRRYGSLRSFKAFHAIYIPGDPYNRVATWTGSAEVWKGLVERGQRIIKKDVLKDLPKRTVTEMVLELSPQHKRLYDKITKDMMIEYPDGGMITFTEQTRLYNEAIKVLVNPGKYGKVSDNTVVDALLSVIEEAKPNKVLIFAWFHETMDTLMGVFSKAGCSAVRVDGRVTDSQRAERIERFKTDPSCQVMLANWRSLGFGVDGLQQVCSIAAYAEVPTTPGEFDQSVSRLDRSGQTNSVSVYLFVPRGTLAVRRRNMLLKKDEQAKEAMADKSDVLRALMGQEEFVGNFN